MLPIWSILDPLLSTSYFYFAAISSAFDLSETKSEKSYLLPNKIEDIIKNKSVTRWSKLEYRRTTCGCWTYLSQILCGIWWILERMQLFVDVCLSFLFHKLPNMFLVASWSPKLWCIWTIFTNLAIFFFQTSSKFLSTKWQVCAHDSFCGWAGLKKKLIPRLKI